MIFNRFFLSYFKNKIVEKILHTVQILIKTKNDLLLQTQKRVEIEILMVLNLPGSKLSPLKFFYCYKIMPVNQPKNINM